MKVENQQTDQKPSTGVGGSSAPVNKVSGAGGASSGMGAASSAGMGSGPSVGMGGASGSKMKMWSLVAVVVVVLLAVGGGLWWMHHHNSKSKQAATVKSLPHVKVGFMMAQTGGAASMGLGSIKGVQLAMKQLGADNIELVQVDSMCDPKVAPQAIQKLIDDKVIAIIGEGCSSASVAALPLANKAKIPMISPSASSPALSIADDYFFRTIPPDDFQASYDAQYVYNTGARTAGLFYTNEPAGAGQAKIFKTEFEKLGGKVTVSTYADAGVIDLSTQAQQLKAANPEYVFIAANTVTSAGAIVNLTRQAGYTGHFFGTDSQYDKTLITNTGKNSEGQIVSTFTLGTQAFKQAMSNEYHTTDLAYAAPQAYDALHAIFIATQRGATTGEQVKNMLPSIEFDGVSGYHIKFDKNGEISDPRYVKYSLLRIQNGDFVEINP